ncbi:unnamed protein product [Adineta steineri]|uniref:Peptidase C1A papain C-terminal domain-containing protein n=1 Tax=Adineta steineri TaxID=433720 RepID=A0A815A2M3_9BILA|nr:unnamed protein product [Adineta steineri]
MSIQTYLINLSDNKQYRLNGIKPSLRLPNKEQLRKYFSNHIRLKSDQLPPKVDFRSEMTHVEDQSTTCCCTAIALAGAYEYLLKKRYGRNIDVSRLFIYYTGRAKKNEDIIKDTGCSMTHIIEALEESGTCLESLWPYDIPSVNKKPNDHAYEQAKNHKITDAFKLNFDLNEMKTCLAQGFPFAFGIHLYKSFNKATTCGVVPQPTADEQARDKHASHAMLAVGYSDQSQAFICRNSWGNSWGDQGYCYISYNYIANSDFCFDAWAIREYETNDMGHDNWDNDDSTDYINRNGNDDINDNEDRHEIRDIKVDENDISGKDGVIDDNNGTSITSSSSYN